jgi:N-acetylglucosamine kinase-like BadF-type ATPase
MSEIYSQPAEAGSEQPAPATAAPRGGAERHGGRALVIGVDAGGTRSRACLAVARPGGEVLGRGGGGPGNAMSVARADLTRHLTEAVAGAVAQALAVEPDVRTRVVAAFGGFAGAAPGLGPERGDALAVSCLRDALAANGMTGVPVGVGGDTEVALAAAPGAPADGLVLIAGTGAIASRLTGRRRAAVSDGHGWLLGDEGSGYWLGGHAVRAALEALDGRGPWTALVPRVVAHYLGAEGTVAPGGDGGGPAGAGGDRSAGAGGDGGRSAGEGAGGDGVVRALEVGPSADPLVRHTLGETIVAAAYAQQPARLAALSPVVVEAAGEGDAVALRLLDDAAGLLAATVRSLAPRPGEPLVATGGLLGPDGPLLARVTARLADCGLRVFPVADGSTGAAVLAGYVR